MENRGSNLSRSGRRNPAAHELDVALRDKYGPDVIAALTEAETEAMIRSPNGRVGRRVDAEIDQNLRGARTQASATRGNS